MSVEQFDAQWQHICDQAEALHNNADAYKDRNVAMLFRKCGWTQQQIADRIGKTQHYVCYLLKFGAFLHFITAVIKSPIPKNVTERKFRGYWEQTAKGSKESARFRQVYDAMEKDFVLQADPKPVGKMLRAQCTDWVYRSADEMADAIGVDRDRVRHAMCRMKGCRVQSKQRGTGSGTETIYRLKKVKHVAKKVDVSSLADELLEICKEGLKLTAESNQIEYSRKMAAREFDRIKRKLESLFSE